MTCENCSHFSVCAVKPKHYTSYKVIHGKLTDIHYENPVKCEHFLEPTPEGFWIEKGRHHNEQFINVGCSNCGRTVSLRKYKYYPTGKDEITEFAECNPFCGGCGATMRLGEKPDE